MVGSGTKIMYTGAPRGVYMLRAALEAEGLAVTHSPVEEQRGGVGDNVHAVVMWVTEGAIKGAAAYGGGVLVKKVVDKFKRDHPGPRIDVTNDGG